MVKNNNNKNRTIFLILSLALTVFMLAVTVHDASIKNQGIKILGNKINDLEIKIEVLSEEKELIQNKYDSLEIKSRDITIENKVLKKKYNDYKDYTHLLTQSYYINAGYTILSGFYKSGSEQCFSSIVFKETNQDYVNILQDLESIITIFIDSGIYNETETNFYESEIINIKNAYITLQEDRIVINSLYQ